MKMATGVDKTGELLVTEEGNTRPEVLDRISVIVKGPSYEVVYLEKLCKHMHGKVFQRYTVNNCI